MYIPGLGDPATSANFPGRRHPQLLRSIVGSGASLLGSPERSGGKAGLAASALLSGSAVPATSPSSTGCAPVGGSLESRGCRFFPRPNLLNTLPAPTSGGARPHRGGGREGRRGLSPQLAAVLPPSNPASASAHPSTSPEPREMRTPNPWAPVALPQQWDPFRRRKLQAGKFRVRTAPGDVATSLCPALPWGVSIGGGNRGWGDAPTFSYRPLHLRGRGRHVWRRKVERRRYNP